MPPMNPEEDEGGEAQVLSAESMLSSEPLIPPLKIRIPLTMLKIGSSFRVFIVVPHPDVKFFIITHVYFETADYNEQSLYRLS